MTRLWLELATFRSGGERSIFTLPVGSYYVNSIQGAMICEKIQNILTLLSVLIADLYIYKKNVQPRWFDY